MTDFNKTVEMDNIHKSFGKVKALKGVDFAVRPAEVMGLVGDNGAGKSTLIKCLTGVLTPDDGEITIKNNTVGRGYSPSDARDMGIQSVYQDQALAPNQPIWRNIFMGRMDAGFGGFIDVDELKAEARNTMREIGFTGDFSPDSEIRELSGGERAGVAMARAMYFEADLVVLDEPTLGLSVKESNRVLEFVDELRSEEVSSIFVTHNIQDVYSVANRFMILENGNKLATVDKEETSIEELRKILSGEVEI